MKNFIAQRPFTFALFVLLILEAFVLGALLFSHLSGVSLISLDLPLLALNALLAIILLTALGWWREAGFKAPAQWQNLHLMIIPALLLVVPAFLFQARPPAAGQMIVLIVITLLIGFQEEAIFRGVLLRAFMPRGAMPAVLISAALFGLIHANSFLVGRDPLFVWAQIIASFLGAIGLGALRIRLNAIWPLVLLHALNDFLQFSATGGIEAQEVAVYIPLVKIVVSGLMALYGLYLLRGQKGRELAYQISG